MFVGLAGAGIDAAVVKHQAIRLPLFQLGHGREIIERQKTLLWFKLLVRNDEQVIGNHRIFFNKQT